mmetsp:Transcript_60948/g.170060  ORF Transcript_60948/g.170060 Transcript_60948/m.170060 type:complete len:236 (+) Transcript_60948:539-1246(+)
MGGHAAGQPLDDLAGPGPEAEAEGQGPLRPEGVGPARGLLPEEGRPGLLHLFHLGQHVAGSGTSQGRPVQTVAAESNQVRLRGGTCRAARRRLPGEGERGEPAARRGRREPPRHGEGRREPVVVGRLVREARRVPDDVLGVRAPHRAASSLRRGSGLSPELLVLAEDALHVEHQAFQRLVHARRVGAGDSVPPPADVLLVGPSHGGLQHGRRRRRWRGPANHRSLDQERVALDQE